MEAVGHGREKGDHRTSTAGGCSSRPTRAQGAHDVHRPQRLVEDDVECDRRRGRPVMSTATASAGPRRSRTSRQPHGPEARGGGGMNTKELAFAASTIWVLIAAVLVMFMQAAFAFLEAGLTRMKNVGHIAAKNVLIFALASVVLHHRLRPRVRRRRQRLGGLARRRRAVGRRAARDRPGAVFLVRSIPAAAGYIFEVVFCAVSLAIVWGAMAERTKLWVYFAFGVGSPSSTRSRRTGSGRPRAGCSRRACRTSPGRRSSTTRAHWPGSRARCCSGRGSGSSPRTASRTPIPWAQHGLHHARCDHPLVRLVWVQPGLDARSRLSSRSASSLTSH